MPVPMAQPASLPPPDPGHEGPFGPVPLVQRTWVPVAGRAVALNVVELGLACCGIEVREARRRVSPAGVAGLVDSLVRDDDGGEPAGLDTPGANPEAGLAPGRDPAPDLHVRAPGADLNVLVVAGTVTTRLAPALRQALEQLPHPRAVLAFGACAATGGPYWDSYSVLPGAQRVIDVDVWVPGCPPRPEDLRAGLEAVVRGRL